MDGLGIPVAVLATYGPGLATPVTADTKNAADGTSRRTYSTADDTPDGACRCRSLVGAMFRAADRALSK